EHLQVGVGFVQAQLDGALDVGTTAGGVDGEQRGSEGTSCGSLPAAGRPDQEVGVHRAGGGGLQRGDGSSLADDVVPDVGPLDEGLDVGRGEGGPEVGGVGHVPILPDEGSAQIREACGDRGPDGVGDVVGGAGGVDDDPAVRVG